MMGGRLSSGRVTILDEKSFYIPNLMLRAVDPGEQKKFYSIKREVSVCLFACMSVCLFGIGGQTTGWIPNKFGMGHPMGPVGNLEIIFGG